MADIPGLDMGPGGISYIYVLKGESMFLSSDFTCGHHKLSSPLAYCSVASIWSFIPLKILFQIIPEISFMSFLPPASL